MISELQLKFGRAPGTAPTPIPLTPITVFVGPNNSGKSRILTEIDEYCSNGPTATSMILDSLTFVGATETQAKSSLESLRVPPATGEAVQAGHILLASRRGGRVNVPSDPLINAIQAPSSNIAVYCQWFLKHVVLKLDGQSRIGLVTAQNAGDLQEPAHTSFQDLFRNNAKRQEVRRIVKDAFGLHFVLDPTNIGTLRIRLSQRPPADEMEERGLHEAAVKFHSGAQPIELASDGVKAFTGIITEVIAGDPRILLIDEPEAFLHPSLAFNLGYELSRASLNSDKRVFVSTHSPSFVMGCIQSGAPVNIIRLTYRDSVATARVLPSADLLKLMRNPLLRSTGVLSGLFYEFVIVTEADADRAFYQEINERLLRYRPEWGIPNCLFLHAQNKQTVRTIMRPLRELGIPTAAIVDIDVLKEGGGTWANLLTASGMPSISHGSLAAYRASVMSAFVASGRDMKRDGGLSILSGSDHEAALNLLQSLAEYGTFVVPGGELESWLKALGASNHGPNWLIAVFEAMGEDPDSAGYLLPGSDDVWAFLEKVRSWLVDARRKGIPA
jgi:hypothetical protein